MHEMICRSGSFSSVTRDGGVAAAPGSRGITALSG